VPLGLVREGSYLHGYEIDLETHVFGNLITWLADPAHFGNLITLLPVQIGNEVDWVVSPAHFGNEITSIPHA
jgi:hypothetical protein